MDDNGRAEKILLLEDALQKSNDKLVKQQVLLKQLVSPPLQYAMVVNADSDPKLSFVNKLAGKMITIMTDNGTIKEVFAPDKTVKNGDILLLSGDTSQVVGKTNCPGGDIVATVKKVLSECRCEVVLGSESIIAFMKDVDIEEGDRVILNERFRFITGKIPVDNFDIEASDEIGWDDIGGLSDAKQLMKDIIELPYKYPDIFKYYNKKICKGVLLSGPPGCGKTMIGKAVATMVKSIYKTKEKGGFIYIKGPEILNRYVGESEAHIRRIFAEAKRFKAKTKAPAIIFIDEAESILNRRGSGRSSDVDRTIVPMFLAEMDGLTESAAIVILATNKETYLDPAVVREGRIDHKVRIDRPTKQCSADIFYLYIKNIPLCDCQTPDELANIAANELFSDDKALLRITDKAQSYLFKLSHIVSGGMIAAIVNQATTISMKRDLKTGRKSGLRIKDILASINLSHRQNAAMEHKEYVDEFIEANGIKPIKVEKVKL